MNEITLKRESLWILREKYDGNKNSAFFDDILRLRRGEPLDYIIGTTPFLLSTIDVSEYPFIPRTETEFWVERAIEEINSKENTGTIQCLDIFSGSGCIGISLLRHIPTASVTFGEKNEVYIEQIKKNIKLNKIKPSRTEVVQTDLFESITGSFDYIFANPPYIAENRLDTVEKSVIDFEPHEALFTTDDGLFYIKALLNESPEHLLPGGKLFIEFDPWQQKDIEKYLSNMSYTYADVEFWDDIYDRTRILTVTKSLESPS